MKRANLAPIMRPKRVSPEWYCFGSQFSPSEMGLFWYQIVGLNPYIGAKLDHVKGQYGKH